MSGSCLWPLQQAAHAKLVADETLVVTLLGATLEAPPIFDEVPPNQAHDYLVHGDATEMRDDTMARTGWRVMFAVEAYSAYTGSKVVKAYANRIVQVLNGVKLTISGHEHVRTVYDRTDVRRQADGIRRWASIWFTAILREA